MMLRAVSGFSSVSDLESHLARLGNFRNRVADSLRRASIDVLLCPAAGFAAALPINPPCSSTGMLAFQSLANTLNAPAGCLPSGCVVEKRDIQVLEEAVTGAPIKSAADESEANFYTGYGTTSLLHRNMLPVRLNSTYIFKIYNILAFYSAHLLSYTFQLQQGTEGLPIPVQFMSLPWQDELCLHAMREAELSIQQSFTPLLQSVDSFGPLKSLL